jgi:DNA-binding winged helix-turn-helix (wHTH) protein
LSENVYRFGEFVLDLGERRLLRDGAPVELTARYFDALALLLREAGRLVSKDRFMDEVWRGIPVTDEALTQCVRTLRRALGDSATSPRLIETVPKHGYRFIAPVDTGEGTGQGVSKAMPSAAARVANDDPPPAARPLRSALRERGQLALAGTLGAGLAGLAGGLMFGFAGASSPLQPGIGAVSVLLVMLCLTMVVALTGGAGVAAGIALAGLSGDRPAWWRIAGGTAGGAVVGSTVKLLGLDAFNLLLGRTPGDITGGAEGLVLGAAVGIGLWVGGRGISVSPRRSAIAAAVAGGVAGLSITLLGGRLMAGSLALLAQTFPGSRLRLDAVGALFGEQGLGRAGEVALGGLEGALFAACVAGAMALAQQSLAREAR